MEHFFTSKPSVFWDGISALSAVIAMIAVVLTGWLIYRQVKLGVKNMELQGLGKMQKLTDGFRDERAAIMKTFPVALLMDSAQFPIIPPGKTRTHRNPRKVRGMPLTKAQEVALDSLNETQLRQARHVIGRLSDLWQLVEDGFINEKVFLGKYHCMLIRMVYLLEPVRRKYEREDGGNYGQRLLRMRHRAFQYNQIIPKHRSVDLDITLGPQTKRDRRIIIPAISQASWYQKAIWYLQRLAFFGKA